MPFGPLVATLCKKGVTGITLDFVCGVDGGLRCNVSPFRHSSKRDKSKQKRAKKSPKKLAKTDQNDIAHISEIDEGGQPAFCGSGGGIKTDDSILLQVFRRETTFYWYIQDSSLVLNPCEKVGDP